ncbi:MAG: two-component system response regulator [Nitrospira sp.]|nr:MAG: two-component system response regulator [Nitrospira sp.]
MAGELILIIEDNENNLKLVRDVLQFNGYQTAEAMTAEDGLILARSQHPALILLDIQLPGMDGFAALRQLRADPITKSTRVMAVTASAMEQDRQKILEAGFDGYMTKPINVKKFTEEIRTVLASDRGM